MRCERLRRHFKLYIYHRPLILSFMRVFSVLIQTASLFIQKTLCTVYTLYRAQVEILMLPNIYIGILSVYRIYICIRCLLCISNVI